MWYLFYPLYTPTGDTVPHRLHILKNPLVRRYHFGVCCLHQMKEYRWETSASDLNSESLSYGWKWETLFLYWDISISMNYERMHSCANKLAPERELGSDITEGVGENWGRCQDRKPLAINLGHCKCVDVATFHSSPNHLTKFVDVCLREEKRREEEKRRIL